VSHRWHTFPQASRPFAGGPRDIDGGVPDYNAGVSIRRAD